MAGGLVHTVFECISYDWRVSVREKGKKPISRNMFRFANFYCLIFFPSIFGNACGLVVKRVKSNARVRKFDSW
jgi:hypothetical protein